MCLPNIVMAAASLGEGIASMQAANAQADVAEQNARLAESKIKDIEYQKQQQIGKISEDKNQVQGQQRAAMAANGVDSGYGSGLSVLTDTAYGAQRDINETEYNAAKQGYGQKVEAANYRYQAAVAKQQGKMAMFTGVLGAFGQGMAGKTPVAKKWQSTVKSPWVDVNAGIR